MILNSLLYIWFCDFNIIADAAVLRFDFIDSLLIL